MEKGVTQAGSWTRQENARKREPETMTCLQGLHLGIPEIQDAQGWIPIGQYPTNEMRRWDGGWVPLTRLKHSPRSIQLSPSRETSAQKNSFQFRSAT